MDRQSDSPNASATHPPPYTADRIHPLHGTLSQQVDSTSPLCNVQRYLQYALKKWSSYPTLPKRADFNASTNQLGTPLTAPSGSESFSEEENNEAIDSHDATVRQSKRTDDFSPISQGSASQEPLDNALTRENPTTPSTNTWEIYTREGVHELLYDYDDESVTFREYGNISNFLLVTTPRVPVTSNGSCLTPFRLSALWDFYDNVNGFEVPICAGNESFAFSLFYTPLLSSINIRVASTGEMIAFSSGSPPCERLPLTQHIAHLMSNEVDNFHRMESLCTTDVDPESYYSVLWTPIHCQSHSPQKSAGVFLTYHGVHPSKLSRTFPVPNKASFDALSPRASPGSKNNFDVPRDKGSDHYNAFYCNCIGFIPFRAQSEIWYHMTKKRVHRAPLQLMRNAYNLVLQKTVTDAMDHDMAYYLMHDREMNMFLAS